MITGITAPRCAEYMKKLQWLDENAVVLPKISDAAETNFKPHYSQTSGKLKSRLGK
jgi:hypothetical protein